MQDKKQHDGNCGIYMGCLVNHIDGECHCPPKCNCGVEAIHINMSTLESKGDKLIDVKMGGEKKFKVNMQDISQWKEELKNQVNIIYGQVMRSSLSSQRPVSADEAKELIFDFVCSERNKAITEERGKILVPYSFLQAQMTTLLLERNTYNREKKIQDILEQIHESISEIGELINLSNE